jgi:hypothetical protein
MQLCSYIYKSKLYIVLEGWIRHGDVESALNCMWHGDVEKEWVRDEDTKDEWLICLVESIVLEKAHIMCLFTVLIC